APHDRHHEVARALQTLQQEGQEDPARRERPDGQPGEAAPHRPDGAAGTDSRASKRQPGSSAGAPGHGGLPGAGASAGSGGTPDLRDSFAPAQPMALNRMTPLSTGASRNTAATPAAHSNSSQPIRRAQRWRGPAIGGSPRRGALCRETPSTTS